MPEAYTYPEYYFCCRFCLETTTAEMYTETYGACDDCRPYARLSYEALVDHARDTDAHNEFLQARIGWLEAGPRVQHSDEGWPAGAIAYDGGDAA